MATVSCYACSPCPEQIDIENAIMSHIENIGNVNNLLNYVDELIKRIGHVNPRQFREQFQRHNEVPLSIQAVGNLTEKLSKFHYWHVCKACFLCTLNSQTTKAVVQVISQTKQIECVGVALSILVFLYERSELVSSNTDQCIDILLHVRALATHFMNVANHIEPKKLDTILHFVIKATVICAQMMVTNKLCRFISAPCDKTDLDKLRLELQYAYNDLGSASLTEIVQTVTFGRPSQAKYPEGVVGIDKAQNDVEEFLNLDQTSLRVVVIYGVGGIGKTTLATAVFSILNLSRYRFCRVCMLKDNNNITSLQEQILGEIFYIPSKVPDSSTGRERLYSAFEESSYPVFLFIDNVLRKTDLEELLPIDHLHKLGKTIKILITIRNLQEARMSQLQEGIDFFPYKVEPLTEPQAKSLLSLISALDVNMDCLVQLCDGIPVILKELGLYLKRFSPESSFKFFNEWREKGFEGKDEGRERMVERIFYFVFGQLDAPSQEGFLDIANFFCNWEKIKVKDIIGEVSLSHLQDAALVNTSEEQVKFIEIVGEIGRRQYEGKRINDWEQLLTILGNEEKLHQIKGIWLPDNDDSINLDARHLDSMSRTLRVLNLGKCRRLEGQCMVALKDLRFLEISYQDMLSIQLRESSQLGFVIVHIMRGQGMSESELRTRFQLPDSTRLECVEDAVSDSPESLHINGELTSVKESESSNITMVNSSRGSGLVCR